MNHRKSASKGSVRYQYAVVILSLFCLAAGKVQVHVSRDKHLSYRAYMEGLLSSKAKKDLTSGLATKWVVFTRLVELPDRIARQQLISTESKYDLWSEKFYVTSSEGIQSVFKNVSEVQEAIESPGPFEFISVSELKKDASYRLDVVETLNPLSQEKFEAAQKWVIRQKLALRGAGVGNDPTNSGINSETSFSSLFYSLWKKLNEGEILPGELRQQASSVVFSPESITEDSLQRRANK